jgi:hypothetical protein
MSTAEQFISRATVRAQIDEGETLTSVAERLGAVAFDLLFLNKLM